MTISKRRIPPTLLKALDETGLPYDFEMGTRHIKVRLAGVFVGIIPKGKTSTSEGMGQSFALKNSVAQVRRAAKKIKEAA